MFSIAVVMIAGACEANPQHHADKVAPTADTRRADPVAVQLPESPEPRTKRKATSPRGLYPAADLLRYTIATAKGDHCNVVGGTDDVWVHEDGGRIAAMSGGEQRVVVQEWSGREAVVTHVVWDASSDQSPATCEAAVSNLESKLEMVRPANTKSLDRYASDADKAYIELSCDRGTPPMGSDTQRLIAGDGAIELRRGGTRVAVARLTRLTPAKRCADAEYLSLVADLEGGLAGVTLIGSGGLCRYFTRLPPMIRRALEECGAVMAGP